MSSYQTKYVAFADILGFEALVSRTAGTPPEIELSSLLSALEIPDVVNLKGITLGRVGDITEASHRISTFSDCLAISTEATEKGLMNLLFHLSAISFRLLKLGYLLRGGISKGSIYHEDGKIVGPALVKAYKLEKDVAKSPRVILDYEIVAEAKMFQPPLDTIFSRLTRHDDEDGQLFVHYLWHIRNVADSSTGFVGAWRDIESSIKKFVETEKLRLANTKHLEKIIWFERYWDWATDRSHIDILSEPFPQ